MSPGTAERARILIVEHDDQIRVLLVTLLQLGGFAVVEVPSLEQAYEVVEQHLFDLVLTDLFAPPLQPRMSALQPLIQHCFPIPVGVLTGWQINPAEVERSGCAFVLPKPFDLDTLLQQLTAYLPSPWPPEHLQTQRIREGVTAVRQQEWGVFHRLLTPDVTCVPPVGSMFATAPAIRGVASLLAYVQLMLSGLPGFQLELGVLIPRDQEMVARFQAHWRGQHGQQQLTGVLVCRFREDQIDQIVIHWNSQRLRALLAPPQTPSSPETTSY